MLQGRISWHFKYIIRMTEVQAALFHPLFQQRVWNSHLMDRLKSKVLTGVFQNKTSRIMAEAGDRSEIRGFHDEIIRLPTAVTTCVLNQCKVNGVIL